MKYLNKKTVSILALVLLLTVGVSGTLAYVFTNTESISNIFNPSRVASAVVEAGGSPVIGEVVNTGAVKTNVQIKNIGDTDAYIRATVLVNWKNADGTKVLAQKPLESEYSIEWNIAQTAIENVWIKGADDYYYYTSPVAAEVGLTGVLINNAQLAEGVVPPTGTDGTQYYLSVEIVASAIQSTPETTVKDQWGVVVENGLIVG